VQLPPTPVRPNASIVEAAARGDEPAWRQLVDRYTGLLWGIARAHQLTGSDAADVVQTSWLRLIEHLPEIRNPDCVGAWLATTARRECLRTLRRSARLRVQPADAIELLGDEEASDVDAALLRGERDAALWRAFRRLPGRDRALLRLLSSDPAPSYEEIAAALGMPIGSIGPTRARALDRLRRNLLATHGALA
jgi:RNA polymerase sigma factor (sigma-70 family)